MMKWLYRITLVLLVFLILLALPYGLRQVAPQKEPSIAVILKSKEIDFWKVVISGVNIAKGEFGVTVDIMSPVNEEDYITQIELINSAVADGYDAIVLSAIDYNRMVEAVDAAIDSGVPVVIIDSDVNSQKVLVRIGMDNYRAGQRLAEQLVRSMNYKGVVAIVGLKAMGENAMQRQQGMVDMFSVYPQIELREVVASAPEIHEAKLEAKRIIEQNPDLTAIAAVNEQTTIGVGEALIELGKPNLLAVGFDNAAVSMNMLEDEIFEWILVQNQFAMGYLGVEYALRSARGEITEPVTVDTGITDVTRHNMFVNDMQYLIFPFEQEE